MLEAPLNKATFCYNAVKRRSLIIFLPIKVRRLKDSIKDCQYESIPKIKIAAILLWCYTYLEMQICYPFR
jgi:hypothetical protein